MIPKNIITLLDKLRKCGLHDDMEFCKKQRNISQSKNSKLLTKGLRYATGNRRRHLGLYDRSIRESSVDRHRQNA
jgi:hypothetical protein